MNSRGTRIRKRVASTARHLVGVGLFATGLASALFLCWIAFAVSSGEEDNQPEPSESVCVSVAAIRVGQGSIRQWVHADGVARAVRREFLRFEVPGRIERIGRDDEGAPLREGSLVSGPRCVGEKGTLLAELDDRRYQIALQRAEAEFKQAGQLIAVGRAEREQATAEFEYCRARVERTKRLMDGRVISQEEMDAARRQLNVASASLRALDARLESLDAAQDTAAASLRQARLDLEHTRLHTSFDGVIARRNAQLGDHATSPSVEATSQDACLETCAFVVIDPKVFEMTFYLSLADGSKVSVGQDAWIGQHESRPIDGATEAAVEARAVVYSVSRLLTKQRRLVRVKLRTRDISADFFDGERVSGRICVRQTPDATIMPREALCFSGDRPFCYVVDTNDSRAQRRAVDLGADEDSLIEVVQGLRPGELVVTRGRHRLADGSEVRLVGKQ